MPRKSRSSELVGRSRKRQQEKKGVQKQIGMVTDGFKKPSVNGMCVPEA